MIFLDAHLASRKQFELSSGYQPTSAVFFLTDGSFEIELDGTVHTVKKGDVIYLPGTLYFKRRVMETITFYQIRLSDDEAYADMGGVLRYKDVTWVESVIRLLESSDDKSGGQENEKSILLESLFCRLRIERCGGSEEDANLLRCVDYMNLHLAEDLDLSTLCSVSGYSKTVLIEKFRNAYGTPPMRHLISLRLNEARRQLVDTRLAISEIAERCGFRCPYYFSNTFKRHFGQSPGRYRRNFLI